jgi:hypothetical protein
VEVALRTRVQVSRDDSPHSVDQFYLRRSYTVEVEKTIALSTSKIEVGKDLTTISYILIRRTGAATTIYVYRDAGPDAYEVSDIFMAFGITGCSRLALKADADTEVHIFLGGS